MGVGCWFWGSLTPKFGWAGGAGSWCDGSVEEVRKGGLGCDVGQILLLRGSVPSLSPAFYHLSIQSRTPAPRSTGPPWHVPALLSGAGLTVYPAPWLSPCPSSLPNQPLCPTWPFCELEQPFQLLQPCQAGSGLFSYASTGIA